MLAIVFAGPLSACIHVPRTYTGTVTEKTKEALLFHDGSSAHLIIKTNLQAASGSLPDTMAWVIPLPSLPSHFEEANPAIFKEMFAVVEKSVTEHEMSRTKHGMRVPGVASTASIEIHPTQIVGKYQIQPIEILDVKSAGSELNRWLVANGFGPVPPENQRYYLKPGAVFLALKVHGLRGNFSSINPLHIVYKSNNLTLPLKFSTHSGVFNVDLYTFTRGPLDTGLLHAQHLNASPSVKIQNENQSPLLWKMTGRKQGFLTRFEGGGLNSSYAPESMVANFANDPTIDLSKDNSPHLSVGTYGKSSTGFLVGGGVAALILLLGFGTWQRVQIRRANQT